jgi:predicted transcriptional regulator
MTEEYAEYENYVRDAIRRGREATDRGELVDHEESSGEYPGTSRH